MRLSMAFAFLVMTACGQAADPTQDFKLSGQISPQDPYPSNPTETLTPGATCKSPDAYRYPEHIPYCNRSVSSSLKKSIIRTYDQELGYTIQSMPRSDFKIDHYIPLCLGGSNEFANLWPQHKSVYEVTDPLEPRFCGLLEQGALTQAAAIEQIKYAKNHLSEVVAILRALDSKYGHQ